VIKFRRLLLTGLLCFATLANPIPARQSDKTHPIESAAANIAGAILVNGHSMDYLRALTDQFGGRLTGTLAYRRSAEWAANQFREAGIKNVKLVALTGICRQEVIATRPTRSGNHANYREDTATRFQLGQ
jgi:hypothetical protein